MLAASRAATKRFQKLLCSPRTHRFPSVVAAPHIRCGSEGLIERQRKVSVNNCPFRRFSSQPSVEVESNDTSPIYNTGATYDFKLMFDQFDFGSSYMMPKFGFVHSSHEVNGDRVWTAAFKSPITGELFRSGKLRLNDSFVLHSGEIFYSSKRLAEVAAIGRAVDCFMHRGGFLSEVEGTSRFTFSEDTFPNFTAYCEEAPYDSSLLCEESTIHCYTVSMFNDYASLLRKYSQNGTKDERLRVDCKDNGKYWTAELRCPISDELFTSGTLRDRDDEVIATDENSVYYSSKKAAKAAVLGKAVDCLFFRGYTIDTDKESNPFKQGQYCKEEPHDISDVALKGGLIEDSIPSSPTMEGASNAKEKSELDGNDNYNKPLSDSSLKKIITSKYTSFLGSPIDDTSFSTTSIEVAPEKDNNEAHSYWTTSFACPLTGFSFSSGMLKDHEAKKNRTASWRIQRNGAIYYLDKEMSELAAVGKASDYLSAVDFWPTLADDGNGSLSHFCEEDPHSPLLVNEEETEGDFIIQNVSNAYGTNSNSLSPVEFLFETWAESTRSNSNKLTSNTNMKSSEVPTSKIGNTYETMYADNLFDGYVTSPIDDIMNISLNWYRRMVTNKAKEGKELSMFNQTPISLASCNSILKTLANTRRMCSQIPLKRNSNPSIEALAKQIIICMYERSYDNGAGNSSLRPDVESLNSFIQCMKRTSLSDTARDAESLFNDMLRGKTFEGYKLPYPDIETFNAVISHWVLVSDLECQTKIHDLFERISQIKSIRPNRSTFLSALSSSTFHFDLSNVNSWFEKIQNHNIQHDTDPIKVDLELYNAPLPPSGKDAKAGTAIYGREQLDASNIEKWVTEMERTCISPNIQTYESVINGWSRCATIDGLKKADHWARKALHEGTSDPHHRLSLRTFYPLLEGWANTGTKRGVQNVDKWINQLNEIGSKGIHDLKPDGRTRAMRILAWRKLQQTNAGYENSSTNSVAVQNAAKECSKILSNLCDALLENETNIPEGHLLLEASTFNVVIDAWREVPSKGSEDTIIEETLCIIELFNQIVDSISVSLFNESYDHGMGSGDASHSRVGSDNDVLSRYQRHQLQHLIEEGASVYRNAISVITQVEASRGQAKNIHHIESMLRRAEEYSLCMNSHRNRNIENLDSGFREMPQLDLYQEVLNYCHICRGRSQAGDIVRIYMLILDRLKKSGEDTNGIHLTDLFLQMIRTLSSMEHNSTGRQSPMSTVLRSIVKLESVDKSALLQAAGVENTGI